MERRHIWYACFFFILCKYLLPWSAKRQPLLTTPKTPNTSIHARFWGFVFCNDHHDHPSPPSLAGTRGRAPPAPRNWPIAGHHDQWLPMHTNPSPKPWDGGVKLIRSRNFSGRHYHSKHKTKVWLLCNHRLPHPETQHSFLGFRPLVTTSAHHPSFHPYGGG